MRQCFFYLYIKWKGSEVFHVLLPLVTLPGANAKMHNIYLDVSTHQSGLVCLFTLFLSCQ